MKRTSPLSPVAFFIMYFCYIDESGTPEVPGTTSHYVLVGLAIPVEKWRICERDINQIKQKYNLGDSEIHTGWILRKYPEQNRINDFNNLSYSQRRYEVEKYRRGELIRLQGIPSLNKQLKQVKKNFNQTNPYIHLTYKERTDLIHEIANKIASWSFSRLFSECIDKVHFDPSIAARPIDEQAFEQIVSRCEKFVAKVNENNKVKMPAGANPVKRHCCLIYDNNQTVSKRYTELMRSFHKHGTLWTEIKNIIETPFFVDSALTSMVQMADVCAYAIRRYLENQEEELFNEVFKRADRKGLLSVGVRHFVDGSCKCKICLSHKLAT